MSTWSLVYVVPAAAFALYWLAVSFVAIVSLHREDMIRAERDAANRRTLDHILRQPLDESMLRHPAGSKR